ncbi:unnamed protein product [Rotaria magnacalcarata]|uniref:VWFA domain-containing protein n=1 Tax=Rotaria magnacalcarata TaxID=392030 RepID=A0A814SZ81_9BILA|nr:unnamed protein product [Rotaria magnacalcarata]CAF1634115.1 unnamed protein product [Rotaria magnacalcarata]CAF3764669.1 unnamed protein product [Rotaria magnacalcarata]CAF3795661.1 unnamed protein product [Rotaria magnacalcarata]
MEDYVMPCNKFSRRRADFSGQLYLPGLVKAIATDFAYKRIGSSKTAGGKRQYSIMFVIDTSMSMIGHLEHCAIEGLLLLTSSLIQCGIENFGIILFDHRVKILKKFDQPWDEYTIYMLLQNFIISPMVGTNDAMAVEYALDMLSQEPAANNKKMFVLTDGYTTCGLNLTEALVRADSENVEVIGIQIGFERPCVHRFYRDWIIATIPAALCDAFRYKYRKENNGPFPILQDDNQLLKKRIIQGTNDDPQKLLDEFKREFTSIETILRTERDAHLTSGSGGGSMSLDVCFVIDITGSMTPWLSGIKKQINKITSGVIEDVEKSFPDMDFILRYSVVAYRDEGDNPKFDPLPFDTANRLDSKLTADQRKDQRKIYHDSQSRRVSEFLAKLKPMGGNDEPEDVLGALDHAMSLNWDARAKFIVLVCDAPAHGRDCNDSDADRFPNGLNNLKVEDVMKKLTEKNIDLILCHLKATATKKMAETFLTHLRKFQPNRKSDELLRVIQLYNSSVQEQNKPYHFVFVLDESGSMRGQPWTDLTNAYRLCLEKRLDIAQQSSKDFISIVQFNGDARVTCQASALSNTIPPLLDMASGGTSFSPALSKAMEELNKLTNSYIPVLLFMSDGGGSGGPNEMIQIYNTHHKRGIQVHTIAFGEHADRTTLQKLADAAHGESHYSETGQTLAETFVKISAELTSVDGLVDEFAKKVSDAATNKLMLEFL